MGKLITSICSMHSVDKSKSTTDLDYSQYIDNTFYKSELDEFFDMFYNKKPGYKRGIFIFGKSGVGKSYYLKKYLKEHNYDPIFYEPHEQRNKNNLNLDNTSNTRVNVLNIFKKEKKRVVIVIDKIENMNNGDKSGLSLLIKSLKIKKNKKNTDDNINPIICIGNTNSEKKIKELMETCKVITIDNPTNTIIKTIITKKLGSSFSNKKNIVYINNNYYKLNIFLQYHSLFGNKCASMKKPTILDDSSQSNENAEKSKENELLYSFDEKNTKQIVKNLYTDYYSIYNHKRLINDNDRTIVGLIWYENLSSIFDHISCKKMEKSAQINLYKSILDKICISDLMDRVIFQKQIWFFSEYSSLLKIFYSNWLLHKNIDKHILMNASKDEIIFTKVLTKYSTEYNNYLFLGDLCEKLLIDTKDLFFLFQYLFYLQEKNDDASQTTKTSSQATGQALIDSPGNTNILSEYEELKDKIQTHEITRLDINRMRRFFDFFFREN